jgi:hypothetical protein
MTDFTIVNVVPETHSGETHQDSEPSIGVNQSDPEQIVISAFTPADPGQSNGPVYYSEDSGATWHLSFIVPGGQPNDQTFKFASRSNQFYGGDLSGGSVTLNALSTTDPFTPGTMNVLETLGSDDQPFIEVTTVAFGPDAGRDRVYIGHNDTGAGAASAAVDICLDAAAGSPTFTRTFVETRSTGTAGQDGPSIRPAIHPDGTVYVLFAAWRSFSGSSPAAVSTDIVVVRDDNWASGSSPFTALVDPGDHLAGLRVQTGVSLSFDALGGQSGHLNSGALGEERVGGSFTIAVDPRDSDIVMICWAGIVNGVYTLNVQRSTNRGVTWAAAGLSVSNATNPALAIASTGKIGLLYQQLNGTGSSQTWDTHFRDSLDGTTWSDTLLVRHPANTPGLNASQGRTYLGDYIDLVAVGKNFYGTFCADNTPAPANFPTVMATFLRNVNAATHTLVGTDGTTAVASSIDPYFVTATEVQAHADFYVRDWTDSPTSGDTGLEPSTHFDFWATSDVWNQSSGTTPNPPNAQDQPQGENALSGAPNYAFARVRRNAPAPAGSGSVTVAAHFLVSEFGTGSNFVDSLFSDPSDPDITFPDPIDQTVSFAEADTGPKVTPAYEWDLGTTTSDHLCLAVELLAAGDPPLAPGLAGRAPGASGTDPSIVADNNKAQRNLQVSVGARNANGAQYYGIVHNGELQTRDVAIGVVPRTGARIGEDVAIEIVTDTGIAQRRTFKAWERTTLSAMAPGENRWIGVTLPIGAEQTSVALSELRGDLSVNGFGHVTQSAPIDTVIELRLAEHLRLLTRLSQGFHLPAAGVSVGSGTGHHDGDHNEPEGLDFHEHVEAETSEVRIDVDVRIRGFGEARHRRLEHGSTGVPPTASYETYVRAQVAVLATCLSELASGDPFEIGAALTALESTAAGDLGALSTGHATVLNAFDAFLTMLQKAGGDRADILQMVRWHAALCDRAALSGVAVTNSIRARLQAFIDSVANRTMKIEDYGEMLGTIAPDLVTTASALGAANSLDPLIAAIGAASTATAKQSAHRALLLAIDRLV